jgi:hypothetical protein
MISKIENRVDNALNELSDLWSHENNEICKLYWVVRDLLYLIESIDDGRTPRLAEEFEENLSKIIGDIRTKYGIDVSGAFIEHDFNKKHPKVHPRHEEGGGF